MHSEYASNVFRPNYAAITRGIEWSLRAFASMRAVRLFLRARAVINFLMRAVSTKLQMASSEHYVNFPPAGISPY